MPLAPSQPFSGSGFRDARLRRALLILWAVAGACTDGEQRDAAGGFDGAIQDGHIPDGDPPSDSGTDGAIETYNLGYHCGDHSDCVAQADTCLRPDGQEAPGICSVRCTPDDPLTPAHLGSEDTCPEGFSCSTVPHGGQDASFCLQRCTPSDSASTCADASRTCHPRSALRSGDQPVCWYQGCASGRDCPVHAGGACTTDDDCTARPEDDSAFCLDDSCTLPGQCTPGGLCGPHRWGNDEATVGDRCQSDRDCPANGLCLNEVDVDGHTSTRHGYCTVRYCRFAEIVPTYACPAGSTCQRYAEEGLGLCLRICALDDENDCRGGTDNDGERLGDYECYDWTRLLLGGRPVAAAPTCQTADITCDLFGNVSCADFGDSQNTTAMLCRDPTTGNPTDDPRDPTGRCLDLTASVSADSL